MNSLDADALIFDALNNDKELSTLTSGRIFNTARTDEAEKTDKVPYSVITLEGITSKTYHKDSFLPEEDMPTVSILCCADSRRALSSMLKRARTVIDGYLCKTDDVSEFEFSAGKVYFDFNKPCYFQTISYGIVLENPAE